MVSQATREAAADLIDEARQIIHEQGWCQWSLQDGTGRVCVVGALCKVRPGSLFPVAIRALCEAASTDCGAELVAYNNAPSTTVEDVLLTMKRASASLRDGAL